MDGYIKLHRKILENPIVCKDADYFSVWIYLLVNATHKEYQAIFKGEKITLKPGQLITGRCSIAKQFSISESKTKRILIAFENDQQINRQRSNQNSLITILNWDSYQQSDQPVTSQRPASDQPVTTNKNVKNERMKEVNKKKSSRFAPPSLEEVQKYCKERNNDIDAEQFIAFYESKGWKVGNQTMKSWKACIITWEKRDKKSQSKPQISQSSKFNNHPQRTYTEKDYAELERKLINKPLGGQ